MGYCTDLTDKQWQVIENLLDDKDRKRKHSLRSIFNGIFYLVKTGCQWRMLPCDFAPWNTVYYYYRKWKNNGFIEEVHETLRDMVRQQSGKDKSPSLGLIDSRSVKTSRNGGESRGIDGGKKTKGRKQHIITDTLGLILVVVIHAANIHDSKGAIDVISNLKGRFPRLRKIVADGGYRDELIENVKKHLDGYWKLYSGLMLPKSSRCYPKDGLWKERSHGSKVLEGSVKTTKYFQKLHKP